ncbi:MAG: YggT family protein [Caldilineaceae bacterium]|jgi:YggT family protein|nr:YggT family protein [Caldilineaceae bacterium]
MIVIQLVLILLQLYSYVLLARALMSWIPNLDPYNPAVQFLHSITEPVLEPIRKLVPPLGGMIDISMIIAFFGIIVLEQLLRSLV